MKKQNVFSRILLTKIFIFLSMQMAIGQEYEYFEGQPSTYPDMLGLMLDTSSSNVWQIGRPQKNIFDSAATYPNAIVTDTINYYPINNTSTFTIRLKGGYWGVQALQWKQKLDIDTTFDGGMIEISSDTGKTWQNVFHNPYVYKFYGYADSNVDTLPTGEYVFNGTDSVWKNVWLCFDISWMVNLNNSSLLVRFTLKTDSINNNKEGWLIDNFISVRTLRHTINEISQKDYLIVYPNPSSDIIHIQAEKLQQFHIIEKMELVNSEGLMVEKWINIPTKFWFDVTKYPAGLYYLKIKTNIKSESFPIIIKKQ